jgi:putative ABC transport system permease protein
MRTWSEVAYVYHQVRRLFDRVFGTLTIIIGLLVILGITNTLTISLMERTREVGTMLAMGARPRTVLVLFVCEGLTLGVAGGALGVMVGLIVCGIAATIGIPMPPPPMFTSGYIVTPYPTAPLVLQGFCLAVGAAVLASLYPAYRASRLPIAEALRFT